MGCLFFIRHLYQIRLSCFFMAFFLMTNRNKAYKDLFPQKSSIISGSLSNMIWYLRHAIGLQHPVLLYCFCCCWVSDALPLQTHIAESSHSDAFTCLFESIQTHVMRCLFENMFPTDTRYALSLWEHVPYRHTLCIVSLRTCSMFWKRHVHAEHVLRDVSKKQVNSSLRSDSAMWICRDSAMCICRAVGL